MTEDQRRSMEFRQPHEIPVSVSILPAAWIRHREKMAEVTARHPSLFGPPPADFDSVWTPTYAEGSHVDAWGCVWRNVHRGREAIVTGHPVATREDARRLAIPAADAGLPHGFMYLRLGDLRGFEELMVDFAEVPDELGILIDKVLAYNLRQADRMLAGFDGDLFVLGDDLGTQTALPISPAAWRKWMKPCFSAIFGRVRAAGLPLYFHSDGHIHEIIPDLVECGVSVINPQVRANGLEALSRVCRGRVCVDLDLDRQYFPFATPEGIRAHIRESIEALGSPAGGLWLKAEIADDVPLEIVDAISSALEEARLTFSRRQAAGC